MIEFWIDVFWRHRIAKVIEFFGTKQFLMVAIGDKPIVEYKDAEPGRFLGNWYNIIITSDEKPVCEAHTVHNYHGHSTTFSRFNRGKWCDIVWEAYKRDKQLKEQEDKIKQKALFQPLDE